MKKDDPKRSKCEILRAKRGVRGDRQGLASGRVNGWEFHGTEFHEKGATAVSAMQVRIFQPPKSPMQSGRASLRKWVMEFEPSAPREVEPLMGWTSSSDTRAQLRLRFDTLEEAIAYAQQEGLMYSVERPRESKVKPKIGRDHV